MTTTPTCESCGMPIETGRYCSHCVDETGALQSFDDRFERMIAWEARRRPDATRAELEGVDSCLHGHDARVAGPPAGGRGPRAD